MTTEIAPAASPMLGEITAKMARSLLDYNEETGVLVWKPRPQSAFKTYRAFRVWNARFAGKAAGSQMKSGYILIGIKEHKLYAHRIAFLIHHGKWPAREIDHINGIRNDNRIVNLRASTTSQNQANRSCSQGAIPFKGVYRHRGGKYMAQIRHNYAYYYLGYHDTPEEAHAAYTKKANELFGPFANEGERNYG
jgi:hypothetical protein